MNMNNISWDPQYSIWRVALRKVSERPYLNIFFSESEWARRMYTQLCEFIQTFFWYLFSASTQVQRRVERDLFFMIDLCATSGGLAPCGSIHHHSWVLG